MVTGGNGGIGLGMARGLASAGATVVIAARDLEKSQAAVEDLASRGTSVLTIPVDVTQEASVSGLFAATLERCGRLDVLVNNAGTNIRHPAHELSLAQWHTVIDTNLTSAFMCAKAAWLELDGLGSLAARSSGDPDRWPAHRQRPGPGGCLGYRRRRQQTTAWPRRRSDRERGRRTGTHRQSDRTRSRSRVCRLFIVDGAKALTKVLRSTFGRHTPIQRCQIHKARNVIERLPKPLHASVRKALREFGTETGSY